MNTCIKTVAFALVSSVIGSIWAATPVAVWDGDFTSMTQGAFTLSENGNTKTDTYLQISGDNGITLTSTEAINVYTVIMRCEGLNLAAENAQVLFTSYASEGANEGNKTGVNLPANNAVCRGIWQAADWNNGATQGSVPTNYTKLVYNHQQKDGTYAYALGPTSDEDPTITRTTLYSVVGLRSSGTTYYGCNIGGLRGTTSTAFGPATGLKITSLAIFSGTLTEDEMKNYRFLSELPAVTENTTVSALNTRFGSASALELNVTAGVTITMDVAFAATSVKLYSAGAVALSATAQPDAAELAKLDLSGVQGAVLRSWLTPGVIGFNFNASCGRSAEGSTTDSSTAYALESGTWLTDSYTASGSTATLFGDGLSTLSWTAKNVWATATDLTDGNFIQGYLDDGNGVTIKLSSVPYATYDVIIYAATDESNMAFSAKTVNGTTYTWDSTTAAVVAGSANWGNSSAASGKTAYGANVMRVNGLTGPLTIVSGRPTGARGCIAAIQIMPTGTSTAPELTIGGEGATDVDWSTAANWKNGVVATSGAVILNLEGDATLSLDEAIDIGPLTVKGNHTLTLKKTATEGTTAIAAISTPGPVVLQNAGVSAGSIAAPVTYAYKMTSQLNSGTYGYTYAAGSGASGSGVGINPVGGSMKLTGDDTFYISGGNSFSGTQTSVLFDGATVDYGDSMLALGTATYMVQGASVVTAVKFILSEGAAGRTSDITVKGSSTVTVSGTSSVDSNQSSIMFGHWNGPSTFTLQDTAAFTAASDVLVGKTANNHTINISGGTFTAPGIKLSASATGTNTLNLAGGKLALGATGITSYGTTTMQVNVTGNSELQATTSTLPVSQAVSVASGTTLALTKVGSVEAATVLMTGTVTGEGSLSVASGVTLALDTVRTTTPLAFAEGSALRVRLSYKGEAITLNATGLSSANVTLIDTDESTVVTSPRVEVDETAGTVTIAPPTPVFTLAEDASLATVDNWSTGELPTSGDIVIQNTSGGAVTVTLPAAYSFATVSVKGAGTVSFAGDGSLTVTELQIADGAAAVDNAKVTVSSSIVVSANSTLIVDSDTEAASISGAGAVEARGNVSFTASNTFTGGLTVRSGTTQTTTQQGFGSTSTMITVLDGGCIDLANTANICYAFTIAGKGVATTEEGVTTYSGAMKNSGEAIGDGNKQTWKIVLADDALIAVDANWGLLGSQWGATTLDLAGHTLTKKGAASMWLCNTTGTAGTFVVAEGTLNVCHNACTMTGVNLVVANRATLTLSTALSGLASLKFSAGNGGVIFTGVGNLDSAIQPTLDAAYVDASALTPGATVTLLSDSASGLTTNLFPAASIKLGGRFTSATVDAGSITATVATPTKFLHCDFNGAESTPSGVAAPDSLYQISSWGDKDGSGPFVGFAGKTSGAAHIFYKSDSDRFVPYWGGNTGDLSPFHAGAMTVTTVAKLACAGDPDRTTPAVPVWGLGATTGSNHGLGLVAVDATTVAVVKWEGSTSAVLATKTGIENLATAYHFFAVVLTPYETRLYVDHSLTTSAEVAYADIGQAGQLGSLHGGLIGAYPRVNANDDGYFLDDWAIYDAALTTKEIKTLKRELCPDPFRIRLR